MVINSNEIKILFFIHIPKTAGTSFRKAAEDYYGLEHVCYDYAPHSRETSAIVIQNVYEKKDHFSFLNKLNENSIEFLSGHVNANKYIDILGARNSVVFMRDPIQRVLSEYNHFVRNFGYEDDFKSFYTKPPFINRLKRMLSGVPIQAIGFVGLTENYSDSLNQINARYATKIPNLELNKGRSQTSNPYEFDPEDLQVLENLNQEDIELYRQCVELFDQRAVLWQSGKPYVHATLQQVSHKSLSGWAWWDISDESVVVEVLVEDRVLGEAEAKDLRPGILRLGLPRLGYVGFHFQYPDELPTGTKLTCRVKETGQVIGNVVLNDAVS
ncbi:sulfotransferase family 2 domain-containing protein [Amphritea pacifica]|uniref:sulfotransferase family 2 domain-containing protein n=1 Tax=Amphritea pacifica TaxID=2811233 RepID=UPI0019648A19|nr:sulfotransferase family 2 domain-containing protein [Amphritea pacifica]MBN1007307.1 sulfotransferase family 2 domain-containing protein [Amphritea pacifica]